MGYSETQQTTGQDTTGEGAFKADGRGKLRTELTVAGAGRGGARQTARTARPGTAGPQEPGIPGTSHGIRCCHRHVDAGRTGRGSPAAVQGNEDPQWRQDVRRSSKPRPRPG